MVFKLCVLLTVLMVLAANDGVLVEEIPGSNAVASKYFQNIPNEYTNAADEESSEVVATKRRLYKAVKAKYASRRPGDKNTEGVKSKVSGKVSNVQASRKKPVNKSIKNKYTAEHTSDESNGDQSIKSVEKESHERVAGKKPVNKAVKTKYTADRSSKESSGDASITSIEKESSENATANKAPQSKSKAAESPADDVNNNDAAEEDTREIAVAPNPVAVPSKYKYNTQGSSEEGDGDISGKNAGKLSNKWVAAKKPIDTDVKSTYTDEGSADDISSRDAEENTAGQVAAKKPANKTVKTKYNAESPAGDVSISSAEEYWTTGKVDPKKSSNKTKIVQNKHTAEGPAAGDVSSNVERQYSSGQGSGKKVKNSYASGDDVSSKGEDNDNVVDVGNSAGMEENFSAYDSAIMDFSPDDDSNDEDDEDPQVKECRSIYKKCKRSSPLISDYLVCFASFAPCISGNSKSCQNECGPDLISCMRKVKLNSWRQHSECASKYIDCDREKCN